MFYGGFWRRVAAHLVDRLIEGVAGIIVGFVCALIVDDPNGASILAGLLALVVSWLYRALMESSERQATVGKMLLGLRVTDEEGRPITFARATGRHFAKVFSDLTFGVGYLIVAITPRKQGLHDYLARTLVLRGRPNRDPDATMTPAA